MSSLITPQQWADYNSLMLDAADTFAQKPMIWKRLTSKLDRYGEDNSDNDYDDITLKVLCNYNYMRSWPITIKTETGGVDKQSVQVLIPKEQLRAGGYLTPEGYFDYNYNDDIMVLDGLRYIPMGDTPASQMQSDDVFITMVLKRKDTDTGTTR